MTINIVVAYHRQHKKDALNFHAGGVEQNRRALNVDTGHTSTQAGITPGIDNVTKSRRCRFMSSA